ncbi:EAL domain-containing protein [Planomonospora corallina]|uniref:EAL domain-containing protein n=1 Tax=Planomonospora corallina TaxID=1806052 RepID=A0ABV8IC19_9ACTN
MHQARPATDILWERGGRPATASSAPPRTPADEIQLITEIIDTRSVQVTFQPVRDVPSGQTAGFTARVNGPRGTALHAPDRLFSAARAIGRAGELDWICRAEAFRKLMDQRLPRAVSLFVHLSADSLVTECPDDLLPVVWEAAARLRIFAELDGAALERYPWQAVEAVRAARADGWGVALSGVDPTAKAQPLLPALEPDVIAVDASRLHAAAALGAVLGHGESYPATLLVSGVDDGSAHRRARDLGGVYQQGAFHAPAGALPAAMPLLAAPIPTRRVPAGGPATPWELAVQAGAYTTPELTRAEADDLVLTLLGPSLTAEVPRVSGLLLATDHTRAPRLGELYRGLVDRSPLVLLLGPDAARHAGRQVRAADLTAGHPLVGQSCLVAFSPSRALVAVTRRAPGRRDRWEAAVSENPDLAGRVLRALMHTISALEDDR